MKKILVLNGPNLNLLGRRQPEIYGTTTLDDIMVMVAEECGPEVVVEHICSNHEGELLEAIHRFGFDDECLGIVLNAGAYTHTSVALADAIAAVPAPVVEVHLTNTASRESFRHTSYIAPVCMGTIAGFGPMSYVLATRALLTKG